MSTINLATLQSNTALPPTIQNSSAVEIGTFCRAWVNFNGTGTVAIRGSFNVTSITDNGTGDYTLNFTTAMPDANFSIIANCGEYGISNAYVTQLGFATGNAKLKTNNIANAAVDVVYVNASIFR